MIQQIQTADLFRVGSKSVYADAIPEFGLWIGGRHYSLELVQNPSRARMCGFGDKDRRPLAPAAVCKLVVRREDNTIIDPDQVDGSFFLVSVDLWCKDGKQEVNLTGHPQSSRNNNSSSNSEGPKAKKKRRLSPVRPTTKTAKAGSSKPTIPNSSVSNQHVLNHTTAVDCYRLDQPRPSTGSISNSFRTLVGPLVANASKLHDENNQLGWYFVFQDLSVRKEGDFRLRLRLMNVGISPVPDEQSSSTHTGSSPILAQIFTDAFTVYSAKKFPGVPEPTPLLISFSEQGQKLPLRSRNGKGDKKRALEDEEAEEHSA